MAFFNDWQQPQRPPAPRRLSLDDLLAMQQQFQPAPRPQPMRSVADLDQQGRRDVRQQSVIQGLAALGASMQTNDWRYAGQGAADIAGMQQQAVEGANARAEQEWQAEQQRRAQEIEQEQKRGQQAALFGVYEKIAQAEPPGSRLTEKAEAAARAGSMAELQGLLGEVPRRQAARSKGYDPDAWDTAERMQKELAAELERQQAAASEAQELERMRKEAEIKREAEIAEQRALREQGLGSYAPEQYESPESAAARAGAVAEAQERARLKYRADETASPFAGGRLFEQGKQIVYAIPPSEANPQGKVIPLQGAPSKQGDIVYFTVAGGIRMMQDTSRPDLPAVEVPTIRKPVAGMPNPAYDKAYGQIVGGGPTPARPAPRNSTNDARNDAPQANDVRNKMVASLLSGADPDEAADLLRQRYPGGVAGFSVEKIMESAKQQAGRIGWRAKQ